MKKVSLLSLSLIALPLIGAEVNSEIERKAVAALGTENAAASGAGAGDAEQKIRRSLEPHAKLIAKLTNQADAVGSLIMGYVCEGTITIDPSARTTVGSTSLVSRLYTQPHIDPRLEIDTKLGNIYHPLLNGGKNVYRGKTIDNEEVVFVIYNHQPKIPALLPAVLLLRELKTEKYPIAREDNLSTKTDKKHGDLVEIHGTDGDLHCFMIDQSRHPQFGDVPDVLRYTQAKEYLGHHLFCDLNDPAAVNARLTELRETGMINGEVPVAKLEDLEYTVGRIYFYNQPAATAAAASAE